MTTTAAHPETVPQAQLDLFEKRAAERGTTPEDWYRAGAKLRQVAGQGWCAVLPYEHADGSKDGRLFVLKLAKEEGNLRFAAGTQAKGAVLLLGDRARAETVVVCEGESDALRCWRELERLPGVALFCIPGANMIGETLAGLIPNNARVVIASDADPSGDNCAAECRRVLTTAGVPPAEIRRLRPEVPGWKRPESKGPDLRDLIEHLEAEINANGLDRSKVAEHLWALVQLAPEMPPPPGEASEAGGQADEQEPASLPAFPLDALPPVLREWVAAEAEFTQTAPALAAQAALGAGSAALTGKVVIEVKPGWDEPVATYSVSVAAPGERKTSVFEAALKPVRAWEREVRDREAPEVRYRRAKHAAAEQRVQQATKALAHADGAPQRAEAEAHLDKAVQDLTAMGRPPVLPRILVDDATPEAIGGLLGEHRALAVVSDEGGLFETLGGRYANGRANLDAVLKAWSGSPVTIDRKGADAISIDRPALTIALTVQPDVVRAATSDPAMRGRGFLGRFLYYVPESRMGSRALEPASVPESVTDDYAMRLRELCDFPQPEAHDPLPRLLLSDGAHSQRQAFEEMLEPRLDRETGDLAPLNDWAAKLTGNVVRIAVQLHFWRWGGRALDEPISAETMAAASRIGAYLIPHAFAAFGLTREAARLSLRQEPCGPALLAYLEDHGGYEGSHAALLDELRKQPGWLSRDGVPGTAKGLSAAIRRCRDQLATAGWVVSYPPRRDHTKPPLIRVRLAEETVSDTSAGNGGAP